MPRTPRSGATDEPTADAVSEAKLPIHPAALLMPRLAEDEFGELVADIEKNGQLVPITMFDGQVLDGVNRLAACEALGIEPITTTQNVANPWDYVWALNGRRRHLDQGQRAALAVKFYNASAEFRDRIKQNQGLVNRLVSNDTRPVPKPTNRVRDHIAKLVDVSPSTAARALAVEKADPAQLQQVAQGKKSLKAALREAKQRTPKPPKPTPTQRKLDHKPSTDPLFGAKQYYQRIAQIRRKPFAKFYLELSDTQRTEFWAWVRKIERLDDA